MDPFVELSSSGGPNDENRNHSNSNDDDKDRDPLPVATTTTKTTAAPAPPHTNTNNHKHSQSSTLYVPTVKVILPLVLMEDEETATTWMMSHTHAWGSSTPSRHQLSEAVQEPSRRSRVTTTTRPLQRQPATASTNRTIVHHIISVAYQWLLSQFVGSSSSFTTKHHQEEEGNEEVDGGERHHQSSANPCFHPQPQPSGSCRRRMCLNLDLSQFRDSYHASPRLVDLQQVIVGTMVDWFQQQAGGSFVSSSSSLMTPWTACAASGSTRLTV